MPNSNNAPYQHLIGKFVLFERSSTRQISYGQVISITPKIELTSYDNRSLIYFNFKIQRTDTEACSTLTYSDITRITELDKEEHHHIKIYGYKVNNYFKFFPNYLFPTHYLFYKYNTNIVSDNNKAKLKELKHYETKLIERKLSLFNEKQSLYEKLITLPFADSSNVLYGAEDKRWEFLTSIAPGNYLSILNISAYTYPSYDMAFKCRELIIKTGAICSDIIRVPAMKVYTI